MNESGKHYQSGAAARFIDKKLAAGYASFSLDELIEQTGLSEVAAKNQLLRLDGRVVRVTQRQQFYLIVSPEHAVFGAPPVEWWLDDYFRWLGQPYYLALQSAAAVYGSSQQAIQVTQVMTDTPRRDIEIGRLRIQFFMKAGAAKSVTRQLPHARAPLRVGSPETTIFDLVRYARNIGGVERAGETIEPMLGAVKKSSLRAMLDVEDEIATAQRLGFVLEAIGAGDLAQVVRKWLPLRIKLIQISTHGGLRPDRQEMPNMTWGVINNSKAFHD